MNRNVTEIQVFVSYTNELSKEKERVKDVCSSLSKTFSEYGEEPRFIVKEFRDIVGEFGDQVQDQINAYMSSCDIFLGFLWMRFGRPGINVDPRTGKVFQSGVEEEFFLADRKLQQDPNSIKIFFLFKEPVATKNVDDNTELGKVLAFKDKHIRPRQIYIDYENDAELVASLYQILLRYYLSFSKDFRVKIQQEIIELVDTSTFLLGIKPIAHYIPRLVVSSENYYSLREDSPSFSIKEYQLSELVFQERNLVLLGDAGSGKTTELQQLALAYHENKNGLIPIYKNFKNYTDQDIESYLPEAWKRVRGNVLLIILDGMDEVQPRYFNTAIRKIEHFVDKYRDVRVVVSCRTNFYTLPNADTNGTLSAFKCFYLKDISTKGVRFLTESINIGTDAFLELINRHSELTDFLGNPFFLNLLVDWFRTSKDSFGSKAQLLEYIIKSRIRLDLSQYQTTIEEVEDSSRIEQMLERIAVTMEAAGRNQITDQEVIKITSRADFKLIKYTTAFRKDLDTGNWMFEHKSIQEYLSARALANKPTNLVAKLVQLPRHVARVNVKWINTLAFLVSIDGDITVSEILNWLINTDPEIVVKFEIDRIPKAKRIEISKAIFNLYKQQNIRLVSNKFGNKDLAKFGSSVEFRNFLIEEFSDAKAPEVVRLNAMRLLREYRDEMEKEVAEHFKIVLSNYILKTKGDKYLLYEPLSLFGDCKFGEIKSIKRFLAKYSKSGNQYVRAGLYKIIYIANLVNDNIDFFIEGLSPDTIEGGMHDRAAISFWDETQWLIKGLSNASTLSAIEKVLGLLADARRRRMISPDDEGAILDGVINHAINSFFSGEPILEIVLARFKDYGRYYNIENAKRFLKFFNETETLVNAFFDVWSSQRLLALEQRNLLELLINENVINSFIVKYQRHELINDDLQRLYDLMIEFTADPNLIQLFETGLSNFSWFKLVKPVQIDFRKINELRIQRSFDVLFERHDFVNEVEKIFKQLNLDEIRFSDLFDVDRSFELLENQTPMSVATFLRKLTLHGRVASLSFLREYISSNDSFLNFQVWEIHEHIHQYSSITINEEQIDIIKKWCQTTLETADILHAITPSGSGGGEFSFDLNIKVLLYFIKKFDFQFKDDRMLDFTLFDDFENREDRIPIDTFVFLEKLFGKAIVAEAVEKNLARSRLLVNPVWQNNARYAISNGLIKSFGNIATELKNRERDEYARSSILRLFFERTGRLSDLEDILKNVTTDRFSWSIVDLMAKANYWEYLIPYLENRLISEDGTENKLLAARYLVNVGNLKGFYFYSDFLINKNTPDEFGEPIRFYTLGVYKDPKIVRQLLRLLKLSLGKGYRENRFNDLERLVLDALMNLAICSSTNLEIVTSSVRKFQTTNGKALGDLSFLTSFLQHVEEKYDSSQTQNLSIESALKELETFGIFS